MLFGKKLVQLGQNYDYSLLFAVFSLLSMGVLMVYSTTAIHSLQDYGDSSVYLKKHLLNVFCSLIFFALIYRLNVESLYKLAMPLLLISLSLLVITLIPGIGHVAGGARRWLLLGPLRFQPGELAKLASIIYFSSYSERHKDKMPGFKSGVFIPFIILAAYSFTLLLEPDFGSTVIILLVVFTQLSLFCRPLHLLMILIATALSFVALILLSPYRLQRLTAFLNPFADYNGSGYQLIQSLTAVGSGGLTGLGLGAGQQKLFYLPAAHTDFIFAVTAEELGIFGSLFILSAFLLILFRGLKICRELIVVKTFYASLALGCTMLMVLPALLNMAVVLGILPTKGLVLPLVAYGGTSMIVHMIAMGILLKLSRYRVNSNK